jgi:hypothetical protein
MSMGSNVGMALTEEKQRTQRKTCPNATLSTINPTQTDPDANPGLYIKIKSVYLRQNKQTG